MTCTMRGALAAAMVLATPFSAGAQTETARHSLERELATIVREMAEATLVRRDTSMMQRVTSPEFVVVAPAGLVESKAEALRGAANFRIDSTSMSDVQLHRDGATAVLVAKRMIYGALEGREPFSGVVRRVDVTGPYRVMAVFAHDGTAWRMLAQSLTPIRSMAPPAR